jgi:hypothetical protein
MSVVNHLPTRASSAAAIVCRQHCSACCLAIAVLTLLLSSMSLTTPTLLQVEARIRLLEGGARLSLSGAKTPSGVKKYDAKVCIHAISTAAVCCIVCILHINTHTHDEDAILL